MRIFNSCIFTKQEGRLMQFSNTLIYLQPITT